jgi:hypothetical protein
MDSNIRQANGKEGLAISRDKGKTWETIKTPKETGFGPSFGKDESHLIVATKDTVFETKDGGRTWEKALTLPAPSKALATQGDHGGVDTLGYDPLHDIFYYCSRGNNLAQNYQR